MLERIWNHPKARVGLVLLLGIWFVAVVGPFVLDDPTAYVARPHEPPSFAHFLGTTGQGQDVLAQTVVGARMTLLLGFSVGLLVTAAGALVGGAAGYYGSRWDEALSLVIQVFLLLPALPLAVVLSALMPASAVALGILLVVTGWAWNARLVRAQALSLRQRDFVDAAIVGGESDLYIITREILPNMLPLLASCFISSTTYAIAAAVGLEFIGIGDLGAVSWGTNLYWASNDAALLTGSWWTFLPSGLGIALTGFALVMINFAIDEVANPRLLARRRWREKTGALTERFSGITPVVRS